VVESTLISAVMCVSHSIVGLDRSIASLQSQGHSQWELQLVYGDLNQDEINQLNLWSDADKRIRIHAWSPELKKSFLQYGMSLARGTLILQVPSLCILRPKALEQGLTFMEENCNCLLAYHENDTTPLAEKINALSDWHPYSPILLRRSLMLLLKNPESLDKYSTVANFPSQIDCNLEQFKFKLLAQAQLKDRCCVWQDEIFDINTWHEFATLEEKNQWLRGTLVLMKGHTDTEASPTLLSWALGFFASLSDHDLISCEAFANEVCESLIPPQSEELRNQLQELFHGRLWKAHSNIFAPAWKNQTFSMAISLGNFCHAANTIRDLHLRAFSGPFDWIFSSPEAAAHMISDKFQIFLDRQYFRSTPLEERQWPNENLCDHEFYRQHYGIRFMFNHHDVTQEKDYAFFQRCVERTMHAIQVQQAPLFILVTHDSFDINRFKPIQEALSQYSANFGLLIVRFLADNAKPSNPLVQAMPVTLFHDDNLLALELRTSSRSNGLHFSDPKDEDEFSRLLRTFKVQEHRPKLNEASEEALSSVGAQINAS